MIFTSTRGNRRTTLLRSAVITAAAALVLTTAACAADDDTSPAETGPAEGNGSAITTFAIVAPENESDFGWNQAGLVGAEEAATALGLELDAVPDAGWDNADVILNQVVDDGAEFVIAHASGYDVAAAQVAAATGVPILSQDTAENVPGETASISVSAEQGGYLAGVAAGLSTTSGVVGIVISADDTNWFKMSAGFAEGVRSVDPSIRIEFQTLGGYNYGDSAGGRSATETLISAGADIIFGMGDGATQGYLQAVEAADDVMYIASIGDVTTILSDTSVLLTSVLWNYGDLYIQAIEDVNAGTFGTSGYELNVEDGGLSLQETVNLDADIQDAVAEAAAGVIDGSIVPTSATTLDELNAVLAE